MYMHEMTQYKHQWRRGGSSCCDYWGNKTAHL